MTFRLLLAGILWSAMCSGVVGQVERVWLTHQSHDPSHLVVSWMTTEPGDSVVRFGTTPQYDQKVRIPGSRTLHHVEIPLPQRGAVYHYSVSTGDQRSEDATFKAYPTDVLRVVVVANWHGNRRTPDISAIVADDIHLLLTAGDNVSSIWEDCQEGQKDCITAFAMWIDNYPQLFRSTPLLPAQGNHDREIRSRARAPEQPVYDIDATAFRRFFALPNEQWKWRFDIPDFQVRFIALDFHHISDYGTNLQSCHDFDENSQQFRWYRQLMRNPPPGFIITLHNERNVAMRHQAGGQWHQLFRKGSAVITGFGYYAERAEVDGMLYYDTSLHGQGDQYPDPHSKFLEGQDNYVLLTFDRGQGTMVIELKNLQGEVLDRVTLDDEGRVMEGF